MLPDVLSQNNTQAHWDRPCFMNSRLCHENRFAFLPLVRGQIQIPYAAYIFHLNRTTFSYFKQRRWKQQFGKSVLTGWQICAVTRYRKSVGTYPTLRCVALRNKHCQRHNGAEGWVHITSSCTNLDQISSSESQTGINFKISTKHKHLD